MCSCTFLSCGATCPCCCHPDHLERREAARTAVLERHDPSRRVIDGSGRYWAQLPNGAWACLGYNLTAASLRDLDERFIVAAES